MRKKILLTRRLHDFAQRDLRKKYDLIVHSGSVPMPRKSLISKISGVDGLICFPYDDIDREVIDSAGNLKAISTYSVGYDHIDVEHARRKKIRIGYTPDVLTDATAELAITLMLDLSRRVTEGDRIIRAGRWKRAYGAYDFVGSPISGKTLGILGMGRIGARTARKARGLGMDVIYHSRHKKPSGIGRYVTLGGLLRESDVISIHVPSTGKTKEMIDMAKIKRMKKTAFIINTARGGVIRESDLILALKRGIIAGAALDVFSTEPVGTANALTRMQNVVLSPHIGSSTNQTRIRMAEITVKNISLGLAGKMPVHAVK